MLQDPAQTRVEIKRENQTEGVTPSRWALTVPAAAPSPAKGLLCGSALSVDLPAAGAQVRPPGASLGAGERHWKTFPSSWGCSVLWPSQKARLRPSGPSPSYPGVPGEERPCPASACPAGKWGRSCHHLVSPGLGQRLKSLGVQAYQVPTEPRTPPLPSINTGGQPSQS